MRIFRTFAAGLLLACAANSALGAAPRPSADEIVARHVEARGGAARLAAIRTIIYRGTYREGSHVSDHAVMALMRPYFKLVGDPEAPIGDFAEGYDGSAWEYYGDPGIVLRTVGAASAAARHGMWIDGPFVDYRGKGSTIEVEGVETIGGRETYRLRLTMRDGFASEEFIDTRTYLEVANRKAAPIHAFGEKVSSETRFADFRPVEGILFPFRSEEVEIATGRVLNTMQWREIVVNRPLDPAVFSPPSIPWTPVRVLIDQLFQERDDVEAVRWTYEEFRRAHPDAKTDDAMQVAGYQMLKMGAGPSAVMLLSANAGAYPKSSGAAFGLGRALAAAGEAAKARAAFERALELDPKNERARKALAALGP
ncbi:MAG TPA: tetratricopeptide repeat protein [Thermoanaerobaculia bacterium]|nr:tetratricopeptide repeat protein [Thermoanaerobaculia bacterium]